MRRLFVLLVPLLGGACASTSTIALRPEALPATPPESALLVIYRPAGFGLSARAPTVEVNGAATCDAHSGGAFAHVVAPGAVTITASLWDIPGTSRATLTAEPGKTYYVRMTTASDKLTAGVMFGLVGTAVAEMTAARPGPFALDVTEEASALVSGTHLEPCDK